MDRVQDCSFRASSEKIAMNLVIKKIAALFCLFSLGAVMSLTAAMDKTATKAVDDYNFAVWLYNSGKYDMAADSYTAFLKNYPDHEHKADARFGLAQALFHTDKFEQAAKAYEQVRTDTPDFPQSAEMLFQLGQTYVALGRFNDAVALFALVREKYATHYLADWAMARQAACLISMEKNKEAEDLLKLYVDKYEGDRTPETKAMLQKLDAAGIKAGEAFLNLIERSLFNYAFAQFNQNRFAGAQKSFERFLATYPKSELHEEARFRLAQSLYRQDAYAKAAAAYESVVAGTGKFSEAAGYERGLALYKAAKLKEAAAAFEQMADRFPQSPQAAKARLYSGTALFEAGDFKNAIERLDPVRKNKKELADEASYWVAMSLLKSGRAEEAEKILTDSLRDFPKSSLVGDMHLGLADARLARNQFEEAAGAFKEYAAAFEKNDQAPHALYSACAALHRADKYAESDALCDSFCNKFGKSDLLPSVLFLSGENRFLLKQYARAAERYQEFLKKGDNKAVDRVARAHYRLAWVHHYEKRNQEALAELKLIDAKAAGTSIASEMLYFEGLCLFEMAQYDLVAKALTAYLDTPDHSRFGDDALLKMAVADMKQDKKAGAAKHLERFLKNYPASELLPQVQYQLAECYYDQKAYEKAVDKYTLITRREKTDELTPYALFGIGLCYYDQEQWNEAAQAFDLMAAKYPSADLTPQALYRKARSLIKMKKWSEGEQAAAALLASFPKHDLARTALLAVGTCQQEQQQWAAAAATYKTLNDDYPAADDRARLLYEQAWSWRQAGKDDNALRVFRQLADKFPEDALAADAYFYLAEAAYKIKPEEATGEKPEARARRLDVALDLYGKVLNISKDKRLADKARFRRGWCYWLTDRYAKAAEEFDGMVKEFPESELFPDALLQAAQAHAKDGQTGLAVERFRRFIADKRSATHEFLPDACLGLANCLIITDKYAEAIHPLETLIKKNSDDRILVQAHFLLGKARFNLGKYPDAEENFQEVTKRTKTETGAEAQFYIGQISQAKSDFKAAIMAYLRVIALYREHREWVAGAMFESAKCHEALGDKAQALNSYNDIIKNFSDTKWAKPATERRNTK
jgi:TolA-binding protein